MIYRSVNHPQRHKYLTNIAKMQVINRHGSAAVRKRVWDERPTLFMKCVSPILP